MFAPLAHAACNQGAYVSDRGDYVVVVSLPDQPITGQRYLFGDGRRGSTADDNAPVSCASDAVAIKKSDGTSERWKQLPLKATDTRFTSVETDLAGRLIEPSGAGERPLVVMVHGSERTTALLVLSDFARGYDELDRVRSELAPHAWSKQIKGEYSGLILRMTDDELRRLGRPRIDSVELIWDYDAIAALKRVNVPVLWVLAGEDREAPIETTRCALLRLKKAGKPIDVYLFPDTDRSYSVISASTSLASNTSDSCQPR